jgi:hypothetical protein
MRIDLRLRCTHVIQQRFNALTLACNNLFAFAHRPMLANSSFNAFTRSMRAFNSGSLSARCSISRNARLAAFS